MSSNETVEVDATWVSADQVEPGMVVRERGDAFEVVRKVKAVSQHTIKITTYQGSAPYYWDVDFRLQRMVLD